MEELLEVMLIIVDIDTLGLCPGNVRCGCKRVLSTIFNVCMGAGSPDTTKQFSATPAGCPTIQLNTDTATSREHQTPQVKGLVA